MAQVDVDRILEALKFAHQRKATAVEQQMQAERDKQAKIEGDARIEQAKDAAKIAKEQFDKQHLITQKAADLAYLQHQQNLIKDYQQTGTVPPGVKVGPTQLPTTSYPVQDWQVQTVPSTTTSTQTMEIPGSEPQIINTPETAARQAAQLEEIRNEPQLKAQLKLKDATDTAAYNRDLMQQIGELQRVRESNANAMAIATMRDKTDRYIAGLQTSNLRPSIDIKPTVKQIQDGTMSLEKFNKLPISPNDRTAIVAAVQAGGSSFPDDKQTELIENAQQVAQIFADMDNLILNQRPSDSIVGGVIGGAVDTLNTEVQKSEDMLSSKLPMLAKVIQRQSGVLSNQDIKYAQGSVPSRFKNTVTNIKKRNQLLEEVTKNIDSKLQGLGPTQILAIKQRIGLTGLKPLPLPGKTTESKDTQNKQLIVDTAGIITAPDGKKWKRTSNGYEEVQ